MVKPSTSDLEIALVLQLAIMGDKESQYLKGLNERDEHRGREGI